MSLFKYDKADNNIIIKFLFINAKIRLNFNNRIYIVDNKKSKRVRKIKGLNVKFKGTNNKIIIQKGAKFNNTSIVCMGNNNEFEFGSITMSNSWINYNGSENKLVIKSPNIIYEFGNICNGDKNQLYIDSTKYVINKLSIDCSAPKTERIIDIKKDIAVGSANIYLWTDKSSVVINEDCMFSWDVNLFTSDAHQIKDKASGHIINPGGHIEIGKHVWLGKGSNICKNVKIPDGTVVGMFSLVTKSINENCCVIAGQPAKILRYNVEWNREYG